MPGAQVNKGDYFFDQLYWLAHCTRIAQPFPFGQVVRLVRGLTVSYMTGHMKELSPNRWLVRVSGGNELLSGKRYQPSRVIYGTKTVAKKALIELQHDALQGLGPSKGLILNDLFEAWINAPTIGGRIRSGSTKYHERKRYERDVKVTFGHRKADEIKPVELTNFYDALLTRKNLAPQSIRNTHSSLRAAYNWGWRRELVPANPTLRASVPAVRLAPPVAPSQALIHNHLRVLYESDGDLWLMIVLAGSLGLRRSELVALKWSHINFEEKTITISEGVIKVPGAVAVSTKTKTGLHGYAVFDLHPDLFDVLVGRYAEVGQRAITAGLALSGDSFVFSSDFLHEVGLNPDTANKRLAKHCKQNPSLGYLTIKQLRKFTSSVLEGSGVDETTACALLRDTPETTANHYRAANRSRIRSASMQVCKIIMDY